MRSITSSGPRYYYVSVCLIVFLNSKSFGEETTKSPSTIANLDTMIWVAASSPDGSLVAIGTKNHVLVLKTSDGKEVSRIDSPGSIFRLALAFSDNNTLILGVAGKGKTPKMSDVQLIELKTKKARTILKLNEGEYTRSIVPVSSRSLAVVRCLGEFEYAVSLFTIPPSNEDIRNMQTVDGPWCVAYSTMDKFFAFGTFSGQIILAPAGKENSNKDLRNGKKKSSVGYVDFLPNGKLLGAQCGDDRLVIYEIPSGKDVTPAKLAMIPVLMFRFSANSEAIYLATEKSILRWDVKESKQTHSLNAEGKNLVLFATDQKTDSVILIWKDGVIQKWTPK